MQPNASIQRKDVGGSLFHSDSLGVQAPRLKQAMRTHKIRSEAARELRKAAQAGTWKKIMGLTGYQWIPCEQFPSFTEETVAYGWTLLLFTKSRISLGTR